MSVTHTRTNVFNHNGKRYIDMLMNNLLDKLHVRTFTPDRNNAADLNHRLDLIIAYIHAIAEISRIRDDIDIFTPHEHTPPRQQRNLTRAISKSSLSPSMSREITELFDITPIVNILKKCCDDIDTCEQSKRIDIAEQALQSVIEHLESSLTRINSIIAYLQNTVSTDTERIEDAIKNLETKLQVNNT